MRVITTSTWCLKEGKDNGDQLDNDGGDDDAGVNLQSMSFITNSDYNHHAANQDNNNENNNNNNMVDVVSPDGNDVSMDDNNNDKSNNDINDNSFKTDSNDIQLGDDDNGDDDDNKTSQLDTSISNSLDGSMIFHDCSVNIASIYEATDDQSVYYRNKGNNHLIDSRDHGSDDGGSNEGGDCSSRYSRYIKAESGVLRLGSKDIVT